MSTDETLPLAALLALGHAAIAAQDEAAVGHAETDRRDAELWAAETAQQTLGDEAAALLAWRGAEHMPPDTLVAAAPLGGGYWLRFTGETDGDNPLLDLVHTCPKCAHQETRVIGSLPALTAELVEMGAEA